MIVRTLDGLRLEGTSEEIVRSLREAAHDPCASFDEYMIETARLAEEASGRRVDGSTPAKLVASLIDAGLMAEESE